MRGKLIILSLIILSGCVTQKRCIQLYPPDTARVTTVEYRDSIIPVYISNTDTVFSWGTIRDTIFAESGTAHGRTWVIHDTLRLQVWQTDSTYMIRLDSAIQVIKIRDQVIKEVSKKSAWTEIKFSLLIILCIFVIGLAIKLVK